MTARDEKMRLSKGTDMHSVQLGKKGNRKILDFFFRLIFAFSQVICSSITKQSVFPFYLLRVE